MLGRQCRPVEIRTSKDAPPTQFPASLGLHLSIASAVRWHQLYRRSGSVEPAAIGGDRHSHRAEAQAAKVLGWIDERRDITLVEIAERLAEEGHVFAPATIWRLLERHDYDLFPRI